MNIRNFQIRLVEAGDEAGILAVYAPYIECSAITFEADVPPIEEFRSRIANISRDMPFLVCTFGNEIAGYAYASEHRSRAAYRWAREVSVYIHPEYHRCHLAKALYTTLIDLASAQGIATLLAGITIPNQPSIAFHEKMGFKQCAEYRNIGYKLGQWHNVGWWELWIQPDNFSPPEQITPIQLLLPETIRNAIKRGMAELINSHTCSR